VVASVIADRARVAAAAKELRASRARMMEAALQERRKVVRDLHDGAQQRLIHTVVTLKLARRELGDHEPEAAALVDQALEHAQETTAELRELAHGILPAALTHGGLRDGVDAIASRMPLPIELELPDGRLPANVEATAYFVVAEALTNVAKHAHASRAWVNAAVVGGALDVEIRDDGVGGALRDGSGLVGMKDRLSAVDGRLRVDSPPGGGTVITAMIPMAR
jgi:signal transduction histidine kinase